MKKHQIKSVILIIGIIFLDLIVANEPPEIHPIESEITLEYESSLLLKCKSNSPISWKYPVDAKIEWLDVEIIDQEKPYAIWIKITRATADDVGEYFCINEQPSNIIHLSNEDIQDLRGINKLSSIYIFVNDPFVHIAKINDSILAVEQYQEVIIPCKPTNRDVHIELFNMDGTTDHIKFSYDPKYGFTMTPLTLTDGGAYICKANSTKFTSEVDEQYIQLIVHPFNEVLNKPHLTAGDDGGYAKIGQSYNLYCKIDIPTSVIYNINWYTPNDNQAMNEGRTSIHNSEPKTTPNTGMSQSVSRLTIKNIKSEDQGIYKCQVEDHSKNNKISIIEVLVIDKQQKPRIDLKEAAGKYTLQVKARSDVQWLLGYKTQDIPKITWTNNRGEIIYPVLEANPKYNLTQGSGEIKLKIQRVQLEDSGIYTVHASNNLASGSVNLTLHVLAPPTVIVENVDAMENEVADISCTAIGNPPSQIQWSFTPCSLQPSWPTCHPDQSTLPQEIFALRTDSITQVANIKYPITKPGMITCYAKNTAGTSNGTGLIFVKELKEPMEIWGINKEHPISIGENIELKCGADAYTLSGDLNWYLNDAPIDLDKMKIKTNITNYSYLSTLMIPNIQKENSGKYECRTNHLKDESFDSRSISIEVLDPTAPVFQNDEKTSEQLLSLGEPLVYDCSFVGIPIPNVTWYKNGEPFIPDLNDTRIKLSKNNQMLEISRITKEDGGTYECKGTNKLGSDTASLTIKIKDIPIVGKYWIILSLLIIVILIIVSITLCVRVKRARQRLRELKAAGLANFENGCIDSINPELSLDEQADLLPYEKKYEFPREKLILGKQLGAGAFGVVVKGTAYGILPHEEETTVAVKTVKPNADNDVMKALISELKIMIHMGQHLNVVNLLGAVTKNIAKRELLVIVEYCQYGNIQNFLQKHRSFFVNQLNPETDEIDPSILTIEQREQRWSNDSGYEYNSQYNGGERSSSGIPPKHLNSKGYIRHSDMEYFPGGMDSCNTEKALISSGKDEHEVLSNNSEQPAWRSNYKMDYKGPTRTITTSDLVCWSFQIARGMEYLSSRKVLHGDLAARNILLAEDNVVKICDFGLARSMYKCDNYKKKGESPLPFKWLAIESISDQVFSTYSDVWAYGVTLWELFSLAKVPYPGMKADQSLYIQLRDGYRMEKPAYANQDLYDLMLNCWNAKPESRPLFGEIERRLGNILQENVKDHYVDLNEPYLQVNAEQFSNANKDYVAILGPPEKIAPPVPLPHDYVNALKFVESDENDSSKNPNYLSMSPKTGNASYSTRPSSSKEMEYRFPPASPTITNNLDTTPPSKSFRKNQTIPEEVPILKSSGILQSDSETEASPKIKQKQRNLIDEIDESLKATNNYVNVPKVKQQSSAQGKDAVSNPGYVTIGITEH